MTGFVVGLDFGGSKIALATADAAGEPIASARLDTDAPRGAEQALARALEVAGELVADTARRTGAQLRAAGAVSPGVVGPDSIALAPNVPGWERLALGRRVRDRLGVDTVVTGNDANAGALAETRWGSLAGADPAIYLSLGTGIGAALLVGGRVLAGGHRAAGEIAYALSGAPAGYGDGRAPLEERAGGRFIVARAREIDPHLPDAAAVFASPAPAVRAVVDDALDALAGAVADMAILLDPVRIAVGGGMMRSAPRVLGALRRRIDAAVPFAPEVVSARFTEDGAVRGALALALDAAPAPAGAACA